MGGPPSDPLRVRFKAGQKRCRRESSTCSYFKPLPGMFSARVRLRATRGELVNSDPELWQKDEWQKDGVEKSSEFFRQQIF